MGAYRTGRKEKRVKAGTKLGSLILRHRQQINWLTTETTETTDMTTLARARLGAPSLHGGLLRASLMQTARALPTADRRRGVSSTASGSRRGIARQGHLRAVSSTTASLHDLPQQGHARAASSRTTDARYREIVQRGHGRAAGYCGSARRSSTQKESLAEEMRRLASYSQTSVSLKATLDTGLGLLLGDKEDGQEGLSQHQRTLIQIATFLRRELPVRLARRVVELQQLPEGLHAMPSVIRVREWYEQSFVDIRRAPMPVCPQSEEAFHELLRNIYARHAPTLVTMARGVHELRQDMISRHGAGFEFGDVMTIHSFLDKFYTSRIGIRILIGQYVSRSRCAAHLRRGAAEGRRALS